MTKPATPKNIVFYADDDLDDIELVKDAFAQYSENVEVISATDGSRALAYLNNLNHNDNLPCLIVLDINMPVINGKELLMRLKDLKHLQSIPVILFTTSSQPLDRNFAKQYNAGFITKPIDVKQMAFIAEQFVGYCSDEIKNKIRKNTK